MANWAVEYLVAHPELAALPLVRRHRHGFTHLRPDGSYETTITGKPAHYEASPGNWQPIDTALQWLTDHYGAPGVPVRLLDDGTSAIEGGTYTQRTTRVGILRPSTQSIVVAVNIPVGRTVSGNTLTASGTVGGADWTHELRLVEDGLRETLTLASLPNIPQAQAGDYLVLETVVTGMTFPDGWLDAEWDADGMHFPLPTARDANRNVPNTRRFARTVGGVQYVYTGVPVVWLASASYPVTIDPDYAGMTADSDIGSWLGTWAQCRATSGQVGLWGPNLWIGWADYGTNFYYFRSYLKFNVSGIPDSDTITQINLKLTPSSVPYDSDDIYILQQDWSSQDPLSDANRETAWDNLLTSTKDSGNPFAAVQDLVKDVQATSPNLDTDWFPSSASSAYYSITVADDYDNTKGADNPQVAFYSSEATTEAYRPVLTVLHEAGGTNASITAVTATATADAPVSSVSGKGNAHPDAVTAEATADAPLPSIAGIVAARPISDIDDGEWLPSTALAGLYEMIDEVVPPNDTDYIYAPTAPTTDITCEVKVTGIAEPAAGDVQVLVRHREFGP